jgi:hypothetical protein
MSGHERAFVGAYILVVLIESFFEGRHSLPYILGVPALVAPKNIDEVSRSACKGSAVFKNFLSLVTLERSALY